MQYRHQLFSATIVKRVNSMIIDIKLPDGSIVPAFCSCKEINSICMEGMEVFVKLSTNKNRIIRYKIEFIVKNDRLIFTSPRYEGRLFKEAFKNKVIKELSNYSKIKHLGVDDKKPYIHFELSDDKANKCYIYIKTLYGFKSGNAIFPIDINFFELKVYEEMKKLRNLGHETYFMFIVPQNNCYEALFTWSISPVAAAKLFDAAKNGLQFICYACNVEKTDVTIANKINIKY